MWRNWKKSLGARLLHRTSRRLSLTEAGTVYFEQCKVALDTLLGAEASIGRSTQTPRGQLKLSAPVWCANRRFAEILCAYRERYPEVVVDIRLENRKVDLAAEGFDLALRATREPSAKLIARPLCPVPFLLVADDVATGRLVHMLPQHSAPCPTLFAVYTSRQYLLPKLRSFIDHLRDALQPGDAQSA
jgi:DNA-binding transcriptional LysR family regulator